jgi:hypothetical protein
MVDKKSAWLVVIIGIVLLLPLLGLDFLGGASEWIVAIAVLLIGIIEAGIGKK